MLTLSFVRLCNTQPLPVGIRAEMGWDVPSLGGNTDSELYKQEGKGAYERCCLVGDLQGGK